MATWLCGRSPRGSPWSVVWSPMCKMISILLSVASSVEFMPGVEITVCALAKQIRDRYHRTDKYPWYFIAKHFLSLSTPIPPTMSHEHTHHDAIAVQYWCNISKSVSMGRDSLEYDCIWVMIWPHSRLPQNMIHKVCLVMQCRDVLFSRKFEIDSETLQQNIIREVRNIRIHAPSYMLLFCRAIQRSQNLISSTSSSSFIMIRSSWASRDLLDISTCWNWTRISLKRASRISGSRCDWPSTELLYRWEPW